MSRILPRSFPAARMYILVLILAVASHAMIGYTQAPPPQNSLEARTSAVDRILADYREDQLRQEPETASLLGDKRFNDQLSDLSVAASNAALAKGQTYIQRLSEINVTGLPDKTRIGAEHLLDTLIQQQADGGAKAWQRPLDQFAALHSHLLSIAGKLPFDNAKDYLDYIARLKKIPHAFSQIMTNLQLGADAGRLPARDAVTLLLSQVNAITGQTTETSLFASPLRRFPASMESADRKRISADLLDAITNDVIPSYQRLGRFVSAHAPLERPAI